MGNDHRCFRTTRKNINLDYAEIIDMYAPKTFQVMVSELNRLSDFQLFIP